jgi:hypothetical protein
MPNRKVLMRTLAEKFMVPRSMPAPSRVVVVS